MFGRPYWPRIEFIAKVAISIALFGGAFYELTQTEKALPADSRWQYVIESAQTLLLLVSVYFMALAPPSWWHKAAEAIQEYRDQRAEEISFAVAAQPGDFLATRRPDEAYCLYLRSFNTTQRVKVVVRSWIQRRGPRDPGLIDTVDIEGFGRHRFIVDTPSGATSKR